MMRYSNIESKVMNRVEKEKWILDPYKDLAKVIEELGELSREIRKIEEGRERPDEATPDREEVIKELASEIGDVLFPLVKINKFYQIIINESSLVFSMAALKSDSAWDPYLELAKVLREVGELSKAMLLNTNDIRYTGSIINSILISLQKIALKYDLTLEKCFATHQEKMDLRYR